MNKIEEAAIVLAKAMKDLCQVVPTISIGGYDEASTIDVLLNKENLEKIFADSPTITESRDSKEYPFEKSVMVGEVRFFCLLTEEERKEEK